MDIEKTIQKGESENTEFKQNFNRETIETAAAFTNTKGGIIFIGVSDNGDVIGVQLGRETLINWGNQISQSTEPTVIPEIDLEDVKKYIKNANSSGRRRFEISEDPVRILEKLELLSEKKGRQYELR